MPLLIPGDPYGVTLTGDPYGVTVTGDPTGGVPLPEYPVASGGVVLPALTADGAAERHVMASAAVSLPAILAAGAAARTLTAAGASILPPLISGGVGSLTKTASGAVALPAMTASGAAERTIGAAGAATLPALTASGATAMQRGASGAVTLPAIAMGGDAERVVAASGAVTLPAMTADGAATTAASAITASGAVALPAFTADGVAEREIAASGAVTLPAITADGVATASAAASFPAIQTADTTQGQGNNADPLSITLPSNLSSGDLILVAVTINNAGGMAIDAGSASGWTELAEGTRGSSTGHAIYYKVSNGTDALSVDFTTNGRSTWIALRITGASGNVEASTALSTFTGSPDTASLTPSWGSKKTLFLSSVGGGVHRTISAAPSGYSHVWQGGIASTFTFTAIADNDVEATSEDPGAWTLSGSTDVVGFTIAVEPA